ncbi:hypothetical protein HOLleu_10706 [Holothuria leucospilota]|uniref:SAP domain-containing protein n=1 Tax=Holothuria leucospilota TaxID=206669 RepID=A0A9Q1HFX0_HOLLE|nr:hypothetical protein HOLleu_10706 [Holothuria leucospilota]
MASDALSIDEIKLWNVKTLQDFLRKRGLKVSGRKEELVALVFAALQMPDSTSADSDSAKREGYSKLLQIPSGKLPDPASLQNWMSEGDGITSWLPTMALDIGKYFQSLDNIPLKNKLMSDYKDGKAYSYFASGWVKIFYHAIDENSEFCFLKTECRPSQNINNVP